MTIFGTGTSISDTSGARWKRAFRILSHVGKHGYAPIAKFHEVFSAEGQNIKLGSLHNCDKNFLLGLFPGDGEIDTFFSAETVSYTDDARCRVTNI